MIIKYANEELRQEIFKSGVRFWMIADALNLTDSTFSRKLRKEFSPLQKAEVLQIIKDLQNQELNPKELGE